MSVQRFQTLNPAADLPQMVAILGAKRPSNGLSPQGGWYEIKNVSDSHAEICIYDDIGGFGIQAAEFVRDLNKIRASNITLRISSGGGDVFEGISIYNAIRRHPSTITAYVDSIAASAASFIAMAANKVVMAPHSQMLIHDASGGCIGTADDMRQVMEFLDKASNNIAAMYAEKAGGTVEEWRSRMKETMLMSDREAVDLGLADSIDGEEPKAKTVKNEAPIDFAALINQQMEDAALVA